MKKTESIKRTPIPESIKRKVRQRCGFGCVICGLPLYEYEHMLEWAKVQRHVAEEITLLCREHHGQKTNGLLPIQDVEKANQDPFNLREGVSKSLFLHYSGNTDISFNIGESLLNYPKLPENSFVIPIIIDDRPIISFNVRGGNLFINYVAFNENNELVFEIDDNELVYNTEHWDVEWVSNRLTIREKKGKIFLKIEFNPPNNITLINARILYNGVEVIARKNFIACLNNRAYIGKFTMKNGGPLLGFFFGRRSTDIPCVGYIHTISRYNYDRKDAMKWLKGCIQGIP